MILDYPKYKITRESWRSDKLSGIPMSNGSPSPYLLIALARQGFDLYVLFTNDDRDTVWIEKTTTLNTQAHMTFEDLNQITNDEEFNNVHGFFQTEGVL